MYPIDLTKLRGIVLHLPYHGFAEKRKIHFPSIDDETKKKLQAAIERNFIFETEKEYRLTKKGWLWYVNLLFFLAPDADNEAIIRYIENAQHGYNSYVGQWKIDWEY